MNIMILILYDNDSSRWDLEPGWGFSCLIRGTEKVILFDTGGSGPKLMRNMERMGVSPQEVDAVILSHIHGDHTGGLEAFLQKKGDVAVYLPDSFPEHFKRSARSYGADVTSIRGPSEICPNVFSTGEMGTFYMEQSLVLKTPTGLVVLTGCAHPGIVKIIERAKALFKEDILLALGGFHLMDMGAKQLNEIFARFQELDVRYVGPCHCTGETQIRAFEKAFGSRFVAMGVGKIIRINQLK